jgi:hypothetical protein
MSKHRKLLVADSSVMNRPDRVPLKNLLDKRNFSTNCIPNAQLISSLRSACASALFDPRLAPGIIGDYETGTLMEVLYAPEQVPGIVGFWLNYFPETINSPNQEIRFDSVDLNEYRLAPFVAPNVQGRVMRETGYQVRQFQPAYVKPKHIVDPSRTLTRRAGERPFGDLTLQERFDAIVADNMRRERIVIENRWDWMACQAIVNARITITGDDYPTNTIDFLRDPSLNVTLSGSATWDQTTATPMSDIYYARTKSYRLSRSPIRSLVFGLDAWSAFINDSHSDVQILLNAFYRGSNTTFNRMGVGDGSPYEYQGYISGPAGGGQLDLWTYNNEWEDGQGNFHSYLDQGTVVGIGQNTKGIRAFGAIMDFDANLAAVDMYPKMWKSEDPSARYTMTQSAPLMIPLRPNNTFTLKVVTDSGLYQ